MAARRKTPFLHSSYLGKIRVMTVMKGSRSKRFPQFSVARRCERGEFMRKIKVLFACFVRRTDATATWERPAGQQDFGTEHFSFILTKIISLPPPSHS